MERHYPPIFRRWLGEQRNRGHANNSGTTAKAARICGSSQGSSEAAKRAEPISREERSKFGEEVKPLEEFALREMAFTNQLWFDYATFCDKYLSRYIGQGAEQKVYLKEDGLSVLKINCGRFHTTWLDYFNRLLFHQFYFPATSYNTVGFTESEGQFAVITEQPFAILNQGAPRHIVEEYLNVKSFVRLKNDDYYSKSTGVKLEDLHDENIFLDRNNNLLFIDPVIYFETADLKLGGSELFHFPF